MGLSFAYLGVMIAVTLLWVLLVKRPIYEAILISFLVLVTMGGQWGNIFKYIYEGLKTSLLYSMFVFTAMSIILTKTGIIDAAGVSTRQRKIRRSWLCSFRSSLR